MDYTFFLTILIFIALLALAVFSFTMGTLVRVRFTDKGNSQPGKPKPKKKVKPKLKDKPESPKLTVPECALGKGFGYLRTLDKHDTVPSVCYEKCATRVCEACLDPRKAEKLLKEMNKT